MRHRQWLFVAAMGLLIAAIMIAQYRPQNDQPYRNTRQIAPKNEGERIIDWVIQHPDTFFSSVVATFTVVLALSTIGLWSATLRHADHLEASARAAKASAEALPTLERAYVFIEINSGFVDFLKSRFEILDRAAQRDGGERSVITPNPEIAYQFVNHGKTPAIIRAISSEFHHWTDLTQQIRYIDRPLGIEIVIRAGDIYPSPVGITGDYLVDKPRHNT